LVPDLQPVEHCCGKIKNASHCNGYQSYSEKASFFGADEVFNASEELDLKADRIIMCTGAMPAFEAAFRFIDKKG